MTYDGRRVPGCYASGQEGEHIVEAFWRFDAGAWTSRSYNSVYGAVSTFPVPVDPKAHHLELWFQARDSKHCRDFDSLGGHNYVFGLE